MIKLLRAASSKSGAFSIPADRCSPRTSARRFSLLAAPPWIARFVARRAGFWFEAIKRPVIQQHQHKWKSHDHWLAHQHQPNEVNTTRYLPHAGWLAYLTYADIVSSQKKLLKRFLRSATHATDSTLIG